LAWFSVISEIDRTASGYFLSYFTDGSNRRPVFQIVVGSLTAILIDGIWPTGECHDDLLNNAIFLAWKAGQASGSRKFPKPNTWGFSIECRERFRSEAGTPKLFLDFPKH
jgi:hypothetical protein